MARISQGEEDEVVPDKEKSQEPLIPEEQEKPQGKIGVEPPPAEFVLDAPSVSAVDL